MIFKALYTEIKEASIDVLFGAGVFSLLNIITSDVLRVEIIRGGIYVAFTIISAILVFFVNRYLRKKYPEK